MNAVEATIVNHTSSLGTVDAAVIAQAASLAKLEAWAALAGTSIAVTYPQP